jgi:hypothetical protein
MTIETNLEKIQQLASVRENENYRFRGFLKSRDSDKVDKIVHRLHDELTRQIDCTLCGNCCCRLKPELYKEEIEVLARLENMTPESYQENFCEEAEINEIYLKTTPCRYLEDKKCRIYENRPEECKTFPNTGKEGFVFRLYSMIEFYEVCPIVFNLMERLKIEMRFGEKKRL